MAIKESSTNNLNKRHIFTKCPVTFTINKIGGRWKPVILYQLLECEKRYSEIKRSIPQITEKMLIQHLRELETDGIIRRKVLPVVPPHVEYRLTPTGKELKPILTSMAVWGKKHNKTK